MWKAQAAEEMKEAEESELKMKEQAPYSAAKKEEETEKNAKDFLSEEKALKKSLFRGTCLDLEIRNKKPVRQPVFWEKLSAALRTPTINFICKICGSILAFT